ncbi:hypothetical protein FN846DRAFT_907123 [Sphaerosporella brunnea]|uniref:Uncharacterized protein n=1 Tax=Sphaerosporella brunnea TaxID=1250544 RepID=A0A5J5EX89_9PEZI|nr:hypothetical protein FN846DRAFT_907123 [Sphaerosporella brunnea]
MSQDALQALDTHRDWCKPGVSGFDSVLETYRQRRVLGFPLLDEHLVGQLDCEVYRPSLPPSPRRRPAIPPSNPDYPVLLRPTHLGTALLEKGRVHSCPAQDSHGRQGQSLPTPSKMTTQDPPPQLCPGSGPQDAIQSETSPATSSSLVGYGLERLPAIPSRGYVQRSNRLKIAEVGNRIPTSDGAGDSWIPQGDGIPTRNGLGNPWEPKETGCPPAVRPEIGPHYASDKPRRKPTSIPEALAGGFYLTQGGMRCIDGTGGRSLIEDRRLKLRGEISHMTLDNHRAGNWQWLTLVPTGAVEGGTMKLWIRVAVLHDTITVISRSQCEYKPHNGEGFKPLELAGRWSSQHGHVRVRSQIWLQTGNPGTPP